MSGEEAAGQGSCEALVARAAPFPQAQAPYYSHMSVKPPNRRETDRELDRVKYLLEADGATKSAILLVRAAADLEDPALLEELTASLLTDALPADR